VKKRKPTNIQWKKFKKTKETKKKKARKGEEKIINKSGEAEAKEEALEKSEEEEEEIRVESFWMLKGEGYFRYAYKDKGKWHRCNEAGVLVIPDAPEQCISILWHRHRRNTAMLAWIDRVGGEAMGEGWRDIEDYARKHGWEGSEPAPVAASAVAGVIAGSGKKMRNNKNNNKQSNDKKGKKMKCNTQVNYCRTRSAANMLQNTL
jgi:hypothetical protein